MVRRRGPRLTAAQQAELWRRWRQGESLKAIGRALGRIPKMVHYIVAGAGGIPPVPRQRAGQALTLSEREVISRGVARGLSLRQISRDLGRAPSTVSREVRRHGGPRQYRAADADRRAWAHGRRPKRCRLATHPALRDAVATKLAREWSPPQLAGWLRQAYPDDPTMHVSHETVYRSLFVQSRGVLKKTLMAHLRQRRTYRRPKGAAAHPGGAYRRRCLDSRPTGHRRGPRGARALGRRPARGRAQFLHRDFGGAALALRLPGPGHRERDADGRAGAHAARPADSPWGLMATLTWDRGLELAAHRTFSIATGVQVYFCDPQSPWQRGTNENTNGLLRQYFPKRTDLSIHSQRYLDAIALRLNTRPRKTLGYRTPAVTLAETVASTG